MAKSWRECEHPEKPLGPLVCGCQGCGPDCRGYVPPSGPAPLSARNLALPTHRDGAVFNSSLFRHPETGRWLVAARVNWTRAEVWVHELDESFAVVRTVRLDLAHPEAPAAQEDPRFFWHDGAAHVSFIGYDGRDGTSQLYARLRPDLTVERIYCPQYSRRTRPKEKNHVFFSHDGLLFAVYSIAPHRILRVYGDVAEDAWETPVEHAWIGGHLRGGASPVRVGSRYYHWFHGRWGEGSTGRYSVGVYTFEARWPFRVLSLPPRPLLWADPRERQPRRALEPAVVFPCGAVLEGGRWLVSSGVEDCRVVVHEWDAAAVDAYLAEP